MTKAEKRIADFERRVKELEDAARLIPYFVPQQPSFGPHVIPLTVTWTSCDTVTTGRADG